MLDFLQTFESLASLRGPIDHQRNAAVEIVSSSSVVVSFKFLSITVTGILVLCMIIPLLVLLYRKNRSKVCKVRKVIERRFQHQEPSGDKK